MFALWLFVALLVGALWLALDSVGRRIAPPRFDADDRVNLWLDGEG